MTSVHAQVQFSEQKLILSSAALRNPLCVHTADLDGDGDKDVLSVSSEIIGWYKNDGSDGFGPLQIISNDGQLGFYVYASDTLMATAIRMCSQPPCMMT